MTGRPILGIDLGGTKIGTGLVDQDGTVLCSDYQPTFAHEGPQAVIQRILAGAERVIDQAGLGRHPIYSIGIGAPGPLDIPHGLLMEPPNLPGWRDVPLREIVQERIGAPT